MSEPNRQCNICLDEDGEESDWVSPCRCSGSMKWVHQTCIIRWVREHERTNPWRPPACGQCRTRLRLSPGKSAIVSTLEYIDAKVYPTCKYIAGWFFGIVAFDAACANFGIYAHSQVYSLGETLATLVEYDKLDSVMQLHLTSISLVFINSIPWERKLLNGLRKLSTLLPGGKWLLPEPVPPRYRLPIQYSISQIIFTSVLHPFCAKVIGNIFFAEVESDLNRVVLGGLIFLGVKGFLSMFLLQKRELRRKKMIITPYQAIDKSTNTH